LLLSLYEKRVFIYFSYSVYYIHDLKYVNNMLD